MSLLLISYILVPIAFVLMLKDYKTVNWIWLGFLVAGIFIGVAPFIALAYLITNYVSKQKTPQQASNSVTYNADGSYTVYKTDAVLTAPSPGKLAFRIVGGIIAGLAMAFGLLIVGVILLFTLAPSVACGGSSKCY
jgi:hypothetical protein